MSRRRTSSDANEQAARICAQKGHDMGGNRRRTLELVYSNDRPARVIEPGKTDEALESRDAVEETQAIERFLTYLYDELRTLDKRQPAHLIGAAILALRDEVDGNDRSRG